MFKKKLPTNICILGPRRSGKTTYLATLACLPHRRFLETYIPNLNIKPINKESLELADMAQELLLRGDNFTLTPKHHLPFYHFEIQIPSFLGLPPAKVNLITRDFAGEIFEDIIQQSYETRSHIDELFRATGWLIMLTDWEADRNSYAYILRSLCQLIEDQKQIHPHVKKLRVAVVMAKCERGELWPGRLEPEEDLFKVRLPDSHNILRDHIKGRHKLRFFACSSFGVLSDHREDFDPRPNRYVPEDGSIAEYSAYLRNPSHWRPYGLVSPIYWLATGKVLPDPRI